MANAYQNPVTYTDECLRVLENNIILGAKVSRKHQMEFAKDEMKIGDTLNIRRPAKFTTRSGASFSAQDYTETSVPLVINNQKGVDTSFTSADMTLKLQDFSDRIIKPAVIQIAQQIDIDGYVNAKNTVGNLTGTAGTSPNNVSFMFDIGKKLDDFSTPRDGSRYYALDQASNAAQVAALTGFFNSQKLVGQQYEDGVFVDATNTVGLKIAMSQNIARHTVGPLGGTPLVNGAGQGISSGWANTGTLITDGWTAAAANRLAAGDVFTIAGVNSVNPVTKQSTGQLMQFVVTTAADSSAGGALTATISPAIITGGPFQNVSAAPADNAAITVNGTASTSYARNLAWHKDAFELAVVKMVDLGEFGGWGAVRSQNGFSLRVFRQAAISNDTVGNRIDALYGWCTPYPEQATQQVAA
jgi:P22 coat protein - gene protein 5